MKGQKKTLSMVVPPVATSERKESPSEDGNSTVSSRLNRLHDLQGLLRSGKYPEFGCCHGSPSEGAVQVIGEVRRP